MLLSATCLALAGEAAFPTNALAQVAKTQGPGPSTGPLSTVQSGDALPNGTVSGTVTAIVPIDANTIYIGTPNGGVWKTTNGGLSWTPLTSFQASLSIASLAVDPTNSAKLVAGIGAVSNGALGVDSNTSQFLYRAGALTGLLYTQDGGANWNPIGNSVLNGKSVVDVVARGDRILAASFEPNAATSRTGGLYLGVKNGSTFDFSQVTTLPNDPVTSLVGDPKVTTKLYAAITSPTDVNATGIYRSVDTGDIWVPVFTGATVVNGGTNVIGAGGNQTVVRLAAAANDALAAGVVDAKTGKLTGLYLSKDSGNTWAALAVPNPLEGGTINTGGQGLTDFAIVIDPNNSNIVYIGGDVVAGKGPKADKFPNSIGAKAYTVSAWRVELGANGVSMATPITDYYTANGTTVHADSRTLVFDTSGTNLLFSTDGGIYLRTSPQTSSGDWRGLNGNLSAFQIYGLGFDGNSKRLIVAAQDTGVTIQNKTGGIDFSAVQGADGTLATVNDKTSNDISAFYSATQSLGGLQRDVVDKDGTRRAATILSLGGTAADDDMPFSSKFVLNRVDASKIAVGTSYVYTTTDSFSVDSPASETLNLTLVNAGQKAAVGVLAYGVPGDPNVAGSANEDALLAATVSGLYLRTVAGDPFTKFTGYTGGYGTSLVFDPRTASRFYVADGAKLWQTTNATKLDGSPEPNATFINLTNGFSTVGNGSFARPLSAEFISTNGVNALFVGGVYTSTPTGQESPIAFINSDQNGALYGGWSAFGTGVPNSMVSQLVYNEKADLLAVGTFGSGAWVVYDVTSFFRTAKELWFGKADNDSAPIASQLANGLDKNSDPFDRKLTKFGSGTLTIGSGIVAAYRGATTIAAGTMYVDGSIASSSDVTVSAGTLGGTGAVPTTVVKSGATLSPGNPTTPTGTLTVQGDLTMAVGSTYFAQFFGAAASKASVSGAATLNGALQLIGLGGTYALRTPYTVLTATGGATVNFSSFDGTLGATTARLSENANNVFVTLDPNLLGAATSASQRSIGTALDNFVNNGGTLPSGLLGLYSLSGSALTNAYNQIAGEAGAGGGVQAGTQLTNSFLSLVLNPFGGAPDGNVGSSTRAFAGVDRELPPEVAAAYAAVTPRDMRATFDRRWNAWGQAYGGQNNTRGDSVSGAHDTTSRTYGIATGFDYRVAADTMLGFALAGGGTSWGLSEGLGGGHSDAVQVGAYGSRSFGQAYVSAALSYALHRMTTDRTVTVSGADRLTASFDAHSLGGRVEAGYRIATAAVGITPYGALQLQNFRTPAYTESVVSGTGAFALNYDARSTVTTRTELGAWFDKPFALKGGNVLALRSRLAWAHDHSSNQAVNAAFQTLPGTAFSVNGAAAAADSALVSSGLELRLANNVTVGARFDGEYANRSQTYAGTGTVSYRW